MGILFFAYSTHSMRESFWVYSAGVPRYKNKLENIYEEKG